ncbi:hypothetical protein NKH18_29405 [Streptomyces sp. M10(2022)]
MLLAIGPAMLGGRVLLDMFKDSGQVAGDVDFAFGAMALGTGSGIALLASVGAAFLAVRRATRAAAGVRKPQGRAVRRPAPRRLPWEPEGSWPRSPWNLPTRCSWPFRRRAIMLSVGFAALAPSLLGRVLALLRALRGAGRCQWLSDRTQSATARSGAGRSADADDHLHRVATATLYMQAVESDWVKASGLAKTVDDKNLETLNLVVVGIIVVFSCIMLVNSLYAATSYRSREFGQQRLAGSTPARSWARSAARRSSSR